MSSLRDFRNDGILPFYNNFSPSGLHSNTIRARFFAGVLIVEINIKSFNQKPDGLTLKLRKIQSRKDVIVIENEINPVTKNQMG